MGLFQKNAHGKFDCTEKGCDRVGANGFDRPTGLGAHRKSKHGIIGQSHSAVSVRERQATGPNSWGKYECPHKDCDRKGHNGFPNTMTLGRHLQAKHGQPGQSETVKYKRRKEEQALAIREPEPAFNPPVRRGRPPRPDHQVHIETPAASEEDRLHYCPGCGYDLMAAKMHLHPAIRTNAYIFCPQCKINLAVVSTVLRPEMQAIAPEHVMALVEVARRVSA
jgi:hypothetical protein